MQEKAIRAWTNLETRGRGKKGCTSEESTRIEDCSQIRLAFSGVEEVAAAVHPHVVEDVAAAWSGEETEEEWRSSRVWETE